MKNLYAAIAAVLMTTLLTAPIATGEGSAVTSIIAASAPIALA